MFQPGIKRNNNLISLPNDDSKIIVYIYFFKKYIHSKITSKNLAFWGTHSVNQQLLTSYTLVHPKYLQELHVDNYQLISNFQNKIKITHSVFLFLKSLWRLLENFLTKTYCSMQCPRLGPIYLLYYLRIVVNKPSGSLISFRTTIKICRFHILRILVFHAKYNYVGEPVTWKF